MRNNFLNSLAYAIVVIAKGPGCLNCGVIVLASALAVAAIVLLK